MNIFPDWLLTGVGIGSGTIILNALGVSVTSELAVAIEGEVSASVELMLPVPVDSGELSVTIEGALVIELDVCT